MGQDREREQAGLHFGEILVRARGGAYTHPVKWSNYDREIPTTETGADGVAHDRLHGESRRYADATPETQEEMVKTLYREGKAQGMSNEEIALTLAIARHESGFNPDAAAGTTSAMGLGQFIKKTGAHYGLTPNNRDDAAAQARALVLHTKDNLKAARNSKLIAEGLRTEFESEPDIATRVYWLHHDGPGLRGTATENGRALGKKHITPQVAKILRLVDSYEQKLAREAGAPPPAARSVLAPVAPAAVVVAVQQLPPAIDRTPPRRSVADEIATSRVAERLRRAPWESIALTPLAATLRGDRAFLRTPNGQVRPRAAAPVRRLPGEQSLEARRDQTTGFTYAASLETIDVATSLPSMPARLPDERAVRKALEPPCELLRVDAVCSHGRRSRGGRLEVATLSSGDEIALESVMRGGCGKHPSWTMQSHDLVTAIPDAAFKLLGLELREGIKNTFTANVPTVVPFVSITRLASAVVPARFMVEADGCQGVRHSLEVVAYPAEQIEISLKWKRPRLEDPALKAKKAAEKREKIEALAARSGHADSEDWDTAKALATPPASKWKDALKPGWTVKVIPEGHFKINPRTYIDQLTDKWFFAAGYLKRVHEVFDAAVSVEEGFEFSLLPEITLKGSGGFKEDPRGPEVHLAFKFEAELKLFEASYTKHWRPGYLKVLDLSLFRWVRERAVDAYVFFKVVGSAAIGGEVEHAWGGEWNTRGKAEGALEVSIGGRLLLMKDVIGSVDVTGKSGISVRTPSPERAFAAGLTPAPEGVFAIDYEVVRARGEVTFSIDALFGAVKVDYPVKIWDEKVLLDGPRRLSFEV